MKEKKYEQSANESANEPFHKPTTKQQMREPARPWDPECNTFTGCLVVIPLNRGIACEIRFMLPHRLLHDAQESLVQTFTMTSARPA